MCIRNAEWRQTVARPLGTDMGAWPGIVRTIAKCKQLT